MMYTLKELKALMNGAGGNLHLSGTNITELPEDLKVGGNLDLSYTNIKELPTGLKVGGSLHLSGTNIKELPTGLKVGGSLHLSGTNITELPEDLKVGGNLDLSYTDITELPEDFKLLPGEYIDQGFVFADGILTHIKGFKKIQEFTYYCGLIGGKNVITDGVNYAHCKDIKTGIEDLQFKKAKRLKMEEYKSFSTDTEVNKDFAIEMYRNITGACRQGTQDFINGLDVVKETYKISEIIELTKGRFGNSCFKQFFTEKGDFLQIDIGEKYE